MKPSENTADTERKQKTGETLVHSDEVYANCALAAMRRCGFVAARCETTLGIDTVQFSILETGGIFITSATLGKLRFSGIVVRPLSMQTCSAM
jgi:hypothetical protein